jgi:hypothetical protein
MIHVSGGGVTSVNLICRRVNFFLNCYIKFLKKIKLYFYLSSELFLEM